MEFLMLIFTIGVILVGYGIYQIFVYNRAVKNGKVTTGVVCGYKEYFDGETSNSSKYSVLHYHVDGCGYEIMSPKRFMMGEQKKVYYDPENPNRAVVEGSGSGIILIIVGLMFLGFIAYAFYVIKTGL